MLVSAIHTGHLRSVQFRELDSKTACRAASTINQDLLPGPHLAFYTDTL
jgi:hypothetical protein